MSFDDVLYEGGTNIANALARCFQSIHFAYKADNTYCHFPLYYDNKDASDMIVNYAFKFRKNNAARPDGIPTYIFKECFDLRGAPILTLLTVIFKTRISPICDKRFAYALYLDQAV